MLAGKNLNSYVLTDSDETLTLGNENDDSSNDEKSKDISNNVF